MMTLDEISHMKKDDLIALAVERKLVKSRNAGRSLSVDTLRGMLGNAVADSNAIEVSQATIDTEPAPIGDVLADALPEVFVPESELVFARAELSALKTSLPGLAAWAKAQTEDGEVLNAIETVRGWYQTRSIDTLAREYRSTTTGTWDVVIGAFNRRAKSMLAKEPDIERASTVAIGKKFSQGASSRAEEAAAQMRRRKRNQRKHKRSMTRSRHGWANGQGASS
jgi:hypothetical protein